MCTFILLIIKNLKATFSPSLGQECIIEDDTLRIVIPTQLRLDPYYIEIYIMWLYLLVMYLIPFLCLMIFNFFIYREVSVPGAVVSAAEGAVLACRNNLKYERTIYV